MQTTKGAPTQSTLDLKELIHELDKLTLQIVKEKSQQARTELALMAQDKINNFLNANSVPESTEKELKEIHKRLNPFVIGVSSTSNHQKELAKTNRRTSTKDKRGWKTEDCEIQLDPEKFKGKASEYPVAAQKLLDFILTKFFTLKGKLPKDPKVSDLTIEVSIGEYWRLLDLEVFELSDRPMSEEERKQIKANRKQALKDLRAAADILTSLSVRAKEHRACYGKTLVNFFQQIDVSRKGETPDSWKIKALFGVTGAKMLADMPKTTTHTEGFRLKNSERVEWAIFKKMGEHWYNFENWPDPDPKRNARRSSSKQSDTHNKIQLKNLAAATPLPKDGECSWKENEKIRDRLAKALYRMLPENDPVESITDEGGIGFLSWFKIVKKNPDGSETEIDPADAFGCTDEFDQSRSLTGMNWTELKDCYLIFGLAHPEDKTQEIKNYYEMKAYHQANKKRSQTMKRKKKEDKKDGE